MSESSTYQVTFVTAAARQVRKLPRHIQPRIVAAVEALADDPRPHGAKALSGSPFIRVRVGDYRVVYQIRDDVLEVLVVRVGHRRDIYDR